MAHRLRQLGIVMVAFGIIFSGSGIFAYTQVQAGAASLQAFSEAQNVTLQYNDDGDLIDRGSTETAAAIMSLLEDDWGYPVRASELDPADPLVNTATEYMYQMAVIGYHVMHNTQTVVLSEAVEYEGETFAAGEHEFAIDGRYWTDFDRRHPIEGPARGQAWNGTVHGLFAELGVGTVTASTLQLGLGVSALLFGMGLTIIILGVGLFRIGRAKEDDLLPLLSEEDPKPKPADV